VRRKSELEREIRIGLRTDTVRLEDVRAQYETTQTELLALDAAWRQQQALVQEIIALRQACWKRLKQQLRQNLFHRG
jgi:type VI secretion system protein VasG